MAARDKALTTFLWLSVLMWATWIGGTLFGILVVVPTWNASPPASLRALFVDTPFMKFSGHFFGPPWMVARTAPVLAALVAAWPRRTERRLLLFATFAILSMVIGTLVFINPITERLFVQAGAGSSPNDIRVMAGSWIQADRIRFVVGLAAFGAILRAFS
jgi:hypothetical protein